MKKICADYTNRNYNVRRTIAVHLELFLGNFCLPRESFPLFPVSVKLLYRPFITFALKHTAHTSNQSDLESLKSLSGLENSIATIAIQNHKSKIFRL